MNTGLPASSRKGSSLLQRKRGRPVAAVSFASNRGGIEPMGSVVCGRRTGPSRPRPMRGKSMDDVIVARALHVLAVVIWIGGVSMATTVALPAVRRGDLGEDRFQAFQAIEHRFVWQARTAIIVVGLTGFYMTWRLDLWDRFRTAGFWWMHAMVCLWLLFAFVLFIAEPFILHRHFRRWATRGRRSPSPGCIARTGCCWC